MKSLQKKKKSFVSIDKIHQNPENYDNVGLGWWKT